MFKQVFLSLALIAGLSSLAEAQCSGGGGVPFNCAAGPIPGAADVFLGGASAGANTVKFTGLQLATGLFALVPQISGGGATKYLNADGGWTVPAGGGASGCTTNCTLTGTTVTAGINDSGGINTTGATGFSILGVPVLNLLSNQANPIVSGETQNSPSPDAIYSGHPVVFGYNKTAGVNTYESMITSNLTIPGTVTNHYGMLEITVHPTGGGVMNAELNVQKNYLLVDSGTTVMNGEAFEANADNFGKVGSWAGYTGGFNNGANGTQTGNLSGFVGGVSNQNVTFFSMNQWATFRCNPQTGGGSPVSFNYCVFNQDAKASIANYGHYVARGDVNAITLTSCGTTPLPGSSANDDAGFFTTGAGATACTINFHTQYVSKIVAAIIVPSDGGTAPTWAISGTSSIVLSSVRAGGIYHYIIMGGG